MSRDTSRVRHVRETLLSDNWYTLKKYTFAGMAVGRNRAVRPTIAATAR